MNKVKLLLLIVIALCFGGVAGAQNAIPRCTDYEYNWLARPTKLDGEETTLILSLQFPLEVAATHLFAADMLDEATVIDLRADIKARIAPPSDGSMSGTAFSVAEKPRLLWLSYMPTCQEAIDLYLAFLDYLARAELFTYTQIGTQHPILQDAEARLNAAILAITETMQ